MKVRPSASPAPKLVEHFIASVRLELMQNSQQFSEPSLGEATSMEPDEVFERQIVERHAMWRKVIRTVLAERHVNPADIREIGGQPVTQTIFQHGNGAITCRRPAS